MTAVRRVQIDEDVGVPELDQLDRPARLRGFELDVVSVDIEALAIGILPYDQGPVLAGAILVARSKMVVPVGIEDRYHNQDQAVEQRPQASASQVSQQHLCGFFAFDFSPMDVRLDVNNGLTGAMSFRGGERQRPRGQNVGNAAPLGAYGQGARSHVACDAAK